MSARYIIDNDRVTNRSGENCLVSLTEAHCVEILRCNVWQLDKYYCMINTTTPHYASIRGTGIFSPSRQLATLARTGLFRNPMLAIFLKKKMCTFCRLL